VAARKRKYQTESTREKIQCTKLINLLQAGVFGNKFEGKDVELSSEKISAIKVLLAKKLPDLSQVEHTGNVTLTHEQQLEQLK
jgi:hypothetical protein